jgi:hypothetical protein
VYKKFGRVLLQGMIREQNNPVINKHFELEIKTLLQNAPRDTDKLQQLLKKKERENEEPSHMEDIQRLVTEIEMLRLVLHLLRRRSMIK